MGLFPGTFDPVTLGHLDILSRALHIFDRMIVAVAHRHHKATLFGTTERVEMFRQSLGPEQQDRVEVVSFEGLLVDFARKRKVSGIVRGIRFVSDFEYEFQMALMNQKLCPEIDTIFLMPTEQYSFLNSTLVKEVARNQGQVEGLVTDEVARRLELHFDRIRLGEEPALPAPPTPVAGFREPIYGDGPGTATGPARTSAQGSSEDKPASRGKKSAAAGRQGNSPVRRVAPARRSAPPGSGKGKGRTP